MVFEGKIVVPLGWCEPSTIGPYYTRLGFAVIHDPNNLPPDVVEPQLLPSKLFHPVFANLNLGFYASQATATTGCPSVINWNAAPELTDAIRVWATKNDVAKQCSPLPAQLRDLARSLHLPMRFGVAIVHDLLLRVLRFVYNHISVPALRDLGKTRPGMLKTVHQTVAMLSREGVFDRPSVDVTLPKILNDNKSSGRKTSSVANPAEDTNTNENTNIHSENTNVHSSGTVLTPPASPIATPPLIRNTAKSNHQPSSKAPEPTTTTTTTPRPTVISIDDIHSVVAAILSKHKSDKYDKTISELYNTAANHNKTLRESVTVINDHDDRITTCEQTGMKMGRSLAELRVDTAPEDGRDLGRMG
ncbi:unnamed protein product [Zymoseptoria tritici ST99CH_3D7]|uniref:Uncharacterized protein n=1 Tax=Zymoseptoria tritici (strain ST99CH_3D7) TaxID=1276538 RepID=A0A1X7SA19_ZYMT9|nr:unnamed protein product [Zymoseptoria tritici ST99CH_3D7]